MGKVAHTQLTGQPDKYFDRSEVTDALHLRRSTVLDVLLQIDMENQGMVDKDEFDELLQDERILEALSVLGVDVEHLVSISEHVFKDSEGSFTTELTYGDLLDLVLSLRSDNKASVMDLVELRKLLITTYKRQEQHFQSHFKVPAW